MRLKLALVLVIASLAPFSARADDASKIAKIHEFFRITKVGELTDHTMTVTINQVTTRLTGRYASAQLTPAQQRQVNEFTARIKGLILSSMSWKSLEPEYTKLYADAYTEQQIDDLIAFYKTSTGQAVVEKTPMLIQQASELAQKRLAAAMPQAQQLSTEAMPDATVIGAQTNSDNQ
jgi:hypothetical protein